MNLNIIKDVLNQLNVLLKPENGSITFNHPDCPDMIRCIVSWELKDDLVTFVANHDLILPNNISEKTFAKMLNDSNYKCWRGSLEFDGEDTLIYRSATFLPSDETAERSVFSFALKDFLKLAIVRIKKICVRLAAFGRKETLTISAVETDRFFADHIKTMEKELDILYSSSCKIPGKERSERILNTEHLIRLFQINLSGNDRPGQQFDRSNFNTRR